MSSAVGTHIHIVMVSVRIENKTALIKSFINRHKLWLNGQKFRVIYPVPHCENRMSDRPFMLFVYNIRLLSQV